MQYAQHHSALGRCPLPSGDQCVCKQYGEVWKQYASSIVENGSSMQAGWSSMEAACKQYGEVWKRYTSSMVRYETRLVILYHSDQNRTPHDTQGDQGCQAVSAASNTHHDLAGCIACFLYATVKVIGCCRAVQLGPVCTRACRLSNRMCRQHSFHGCNHNMCVHDVMSRAAH